LSELWFDITVIRHYQIYQNGDE